MAFRRRIKEAPRVDLTPMVDVVFLLLIFFMISTTFIETQGLSITLPKASPTILQHQSGKVQVFLSREGKIFLQDEEVSFETLQTELALYHDPAQTMFLLMADREAQHGGVVQLMNLAKESGFEKLAIATEKEL
ncbi:MAG TPA: biopolymer transporter ExbD [Geopsychrobacteraceae bacterium]|nr:biopolymer transporter ExbD [Geopsychrobacteraceae bacterium]